MARANVESFPPVDVTLLGGWLTASNFDFTNAATPTFPQLYMLEFQDNETTKHQRTAGIDKLLEPCGGGFYTTMVQTYVP